ncbi:MAG: response regulator transcription factor [Eubacteriales bacterium]
MIYCVEDDAGIRNMMVYTLKASGLDALGLSDGAELEAQLEKELPQLLLLDVMLPGKDGLTILKELRERKDTAKLPIIMATAKGTEYDKVTGLDLGADDYLSKPFGMMEMVSRVKAVLRRIAPVEAEPTMILEMGDLVLNISAHTATVGGESVVLALKEFQLLEMFLSQKGMVFTRDQILSHIWDMDYDGETRTVDVHIRSLRTKIGDCGKYIQTVRGVGYRMEEKE